MTHRVLCFIDICRYSDWCSIRSCDEIFDSMSNYDALLIDLLKNNFPFLWKVELIGDCAVIVNKKDYPTCKCPIFDMILFAKSFLGKINDLQKIFNSSKINFRIGIHYGDVITGKLSNDNLSSRSSNSYNTQLFGDTVNVCSRLESSSLPGVINISMIALQEMKCEYNDVINMFFIKNKSKITYMKGVGDVKHTHLTNISLKSNYIDFASDEEEVYDKIEKLKSTFYRIVYIKYNFSGLKNIDKQCNDIKHFLLSFRNFETYSRNNFQKIYICLNDHNDLTSYNFEDIERLTNGFIINNYSNHDQERYAFNQQMFSRRSEDVHDLTSTNKVNARRGSFISTENVNIPSVYTRSSSDSPSGSTVYGNSATIQASLLK